MACLAVLSLASTVAAQDTVVWTPELDAEYARAVESAAAKDYPTAEARFAAIVDKGAFDAALVNLGRAYFRQGRCDEAKAAYDRSVTAPRLSNPPAIMTPDVVAEARDRYVEDMLQVCPGNVRVVCASTQVRIVINDGDAAECPAGPIGLPPGTHRLRATLGDRSEAHNLSVVAFEEIVVNVALAPEEIVAATGPKEPVESAEPASVEAPAPTGLGAQAIAGWSTVGAGGVLLVAVGALDVFVSQPKFDRYQAAGKRGDQQTYDSLRDELDTEQLLQRVGLGLGVSALVTGSVLLVLDGDNEDAAPSATIWTDGAAAGLEFRGTW